MAVDFKSIGKFEQGALLSGGLAIILSFFGAYIRVSGGGQSQNVTNAWDGFGTFACLLLIAAVALIAVKVFAPEVLPKEIPWTLVALAVSVVATLILLLKPFTVDVPTYIGEVSVGPGWSGWILFIALIAFVALTALLFKNSGEKIPEINKGTGATPPSHGTATPPATGTATPPVPPTAPPAAPPAPPTAPPAPPADGPTPPPAPPAS